MAVVRNLISLSSRLKYTLDPTSVPNEFRVLSKFGIFFFTLWTFTLQIVFMFIAIADECCKLLNIQSRQKKLEKIRQQLFLSLMLPCSLIVMSIFWIVFHIDRELIYPKIIDTFHPRWLNHTLHTAIGLPLLLEIVSHKIDRTISYKASRQYALIFLTGYLLVYQVLYFSLYLLQGIWLYPIYKLMSWPERLVFSLFNYGLGVGFQQIGFLLLQPKIEEKAERKIK
ncbi:hypothetical protein GWI33_012652 [Rhynchophorus ferrugineus]|uniref:Androgen-dependent TFPI-regulating protein-like n=1 Tax=Rhynchophorus ferrugineus TaxID=354439 RepID=A0A834I8J5_RHYFE|nr:hypothetical protein GWI33_012652 [Rhynchophorus ferrugineus]